MDDWATPRGGTTETKRRLEKANTEQSLSGNISRKICEKALDFNASGQKVL